MAKKTSPKRGPSPYNVCMGNALKGKGGTKEQVRANFKNASAQCSKRTKGSTYSANPIYDYKCAYCGKKVSRDELYDVDDRAQSMDGEDLEQIYDQLPSKVGEYTHTPKDDPNLKVYNICRRCFTKAQNTFEDETEDDEGLGLERGASDDEDSTDERELIDLDESELPDAFYDQFPDGVAYYDKTNKAIVIDSRGMGEQIIATYQGKPIELHQAYKAIRDEVQK